MSGQTYKKWFENKREAGGRRVAVVLDAPDSETLARIAASYGSDAQAIRVAIRKLAEAER